MKVKRIAPLLILLVIMAGCASKQTPQYKAAIGIDDFSIALQGFQNLEISFHQTGLIPDSTHIAIQKVCLNAAEDGKLANQAVKAGDFTSAKGYFASALALLQGLTPEMLGIKNPENQAAMKTALSVAIAITQEWVNGMGGTQ